MVSFSKVFSIRVPNISLVDKLGQMISANTQENGTTMKYMVLVSINGSMKEKFTLASGTKINSMGLGSSLGRTKDITWAILTLIRNMDLGCTGMRTGPSTAEPGTIIKCTDSVSTPLQRVVSSLEYGCKVRKRRL